MTTGLKQMVAEAIEKTEAEQEPAPEPVQVSDEAVRALAFKMREWSGWADSHLVFGNPGKVSPFASCDHSTRTFTANAERLILNPNRVLLTVTPFRLKQEAVLTGCLLHEASHARHSHWAPRTMEQVKTFAHGDGTPVTRQTMALARLLEEPRIEGLQARDADRIGATGLGWTMRASAAHLVPMTELSVNPEQKIMDLIKSWALRAGRQIGLNHHTLHPLRHWVQDFTTLVHRAIKGHLMNAGADDPSGDSRMIMNLLLEMIRCEDDRGPTMIDTARDILALLFPETPPEDQPEVGGGCQSEPSPEDEKSEQAEGGDTPESESESGEGGEGDEEGEQGEGNTEPEDEGSGDEPGAGDSGQEEKADEPESESGEGEADTEADTEAESEDVGATDSTDTDEADDESDTEPESGTDTESELAQALSDIEHQCKSETEDETEDETEEEASAALAEPGHGAGTGGQGSMGEGWCNPTKDERTIQKGAERFLRGLIEPSEASKMSLTDSPAATVDGAALAAWRAGGQINAPNFFKRTRRNVEPSPPVKVAILVDVSGSMEELQKPSAILSWALASAALDLRNFAGRGQQIESCLIHWGSDARVIQRNGQMLPGIREVPCLEGTSAMHEALDLVAEELPGFFEVTERPVHRLLVQFTDWELSGWYRKEAAAKIREALEAGVNMVTVAPHDYSERRSDLPNILAGSRVQRGMSTLMRYNKMFPEQVWDTAAESLK